MDSDQGKTNIVPCGSCVLCCKGHIVVLMPEEGDRPEDYKTQTVWNPQTNRPAFALQQRTSGGACIYLAEPMGGCMIWDKRPSVCRSFDCRKFAMQYTRRQVLANGQPPETWDRGRQLRNTLPK